MVWGLTRIRSSIKRNQDLKKQKSMSDSLAASPPRLKLKDETNFSTAALSENTEEYALSQMKSKNKRKQSNEVENIPKVSISTKSLKPIIGVEKFKKIKRKVGRPPTKKKLGDLNADYTHQRTIATNEDSHVEGLGDMPELEDDSIGNDLDDKVDLNRFKLNVNESLNDVYPIVFKNYNGKFSDHSSLSDINEYDKLGIDENNYLEVMSTGIPIDLIEFNPSTSNSSLASVGQKLKKNANSFDGKVKDSSRSETDKIGRSPLSNAKVESKQKEQTTHLSSHVRIQEQANDGLEVLEEKEDTFLDFINRIQIPYDHSKGPYELDSSIDFDLHLEGTYDLDALYNDPNPCLNVNEEEFIQDIEILDKNKSSSGTNKYSQVDGVEDMNELEYYSIFNDLDDIVDLNGIKLDVNESVGVVSAIVFKNYNGKFSDHSSQSDINEYDKLGIDENIYLEIMSTGIPIELTECNPLTLNSSLESIGQTLKNNANSFDALPSRNVGVQLSRITKGKRSKRGRYRKEKASSISGTDKIGSSPLSNAKAESKQKEKTTHISSHVRIHKQANTPLPKASEANREDNNFEVLEETEGLCNLDHLEIPHDIYDFERQLGHFSLWFDKINVRDFDNTNG